MYRSEAVILPAGSAQPSSGGLMGMIAGSPLLGGSGAGNLMQFANSKILKARVVKNPELVNVFFPNVADVTALSDLDVDGAISGLSGMLSVATPKSGGGTISVAAESSDPALSLKVVRTYLVELQNFLSNNALSQTRRYRLFLEEQLAKNKEDLLEMGKMMSEFYQKHPVSPVGAKLNVPIAIKTDGGIREFKSYEEFKKHFDILQKQSQDNTGEMLKDGEQIKFIKDVPHQIYLRYVTIQEQTLQSNYNVLSQQYESAKLEEAKLDPVFTILDEPILPRYRFKPRRTAIAFGAFALSLVFSLMYVLFREFGLNFLMGGRKSYGLREADAVH